VAIFIDGCFWHGCKKCYKEPTSNVEFWREKILNNKRRRRRIRARLRKDDWKVLEFWEHQINSNSHHIADEIASSLK